MSYFARLAARASVGFARETGSKAQPAMPSRSPLVEHDQRLTLPGFAERALDSGPVSSAAPSAAFEGGEATPASDAAATVARKASPAFTPSPAAALGLRDGWSEAVSSSVALPGGLEDGPAVVEPAPSAGAPWSAALEPRSISSTPLPSEHAASSALEAPAALPSGAPKVSELAPPARSIFEALSRADAWTRSTSTPGTAASPSERAADAALETRPSLPAITPAVYAEAPEAPEATIGLPGGPMVSIGRLEIEVVAPPRAEPASAPRRNERVPRPAPRAAAPASFAAPRAYGWRQR